MRKIDEKSLKKKKKKVFLVFNCSAQWAAGEITQNSQHAAQGGERKSYVFRCVKDKQTRGESGHLPHLCRKFSYFALRLCLPFLPPKHKHPSKHMRHDQSLLITLRMTPIPMSLICLVRFPHREKNIFTKQTKCPPSLLQNGTRQHLERSERKTKIRFENSAAIRGSITGHVRAALSF